MKLSDFDFDLPEGLIATRPAKPRSSARLLVATPTRIVDGHVTDLLDWFRPGDRLVLNDTKVLPARLTGKRGRDTAQGYQEAKIEVTLLEPQSVPGQWRALIKPLKKIKEGEDVRFSDDLSATLVAKEDGEAVVAFNLTGEDFDRALNAAGSMPLPPYIEAKRKADQQDKTDYQTVWAKNLGAVAAPTASLHFDEPLLKALAEKGVEFTYVTLHVGAGTFLPVKVDDVSQHKMHSEWGEVSEGAAIEINTTKQRGGRVIPVGTTALRLIESAAPAPGVIAPFLGETDIFIKPGYEFRVADALMTNFHLPKSTLMMLVSAMMGRERMRQVYDHAVTEGYRFFSYGDASLLLPQEP
ncbi:tRNA preQ1(34) S-adenosylmethionine ribosyltransferase-isomerase QueA [Celeribacter sp. SCSIO 80788]|uniref:tRNA preQ1(34) S-adenosylmethionine ribosyltransferase-isomerase QueA n=1 Tax=Celeribacter sp. SCSIO 80788 TaxID=3117013 RepID=UPI003DA29F04